MGTANFGIAGVDWQQRVNWDRLRTYRTERAPRDDEEERGLGAMLQCMYDENVRYLTGTLTPAGTGSSPACATPCCAATARRSCSSRATSASRSSGTARGSRRRMSTALVRLNKGAAGPASTQQVKKLTAAVLQAMKEHGVAGQKVSAPTSSTST